MFHFFSWYKNFSLNNRCSVSVWVCVTTNLDQEEGDAVCPQRTSQLDVFHFSFDLSHFPTVLVLLRVELNVYWASEQLVHNCQMSRVWSISLKTVTTPGILSSQLLFVLCILWVETPSGWERNETNTRSWKSCRKHDLIVPATACKTNQSYSLPMLHLWYENNCFYHCFHDRLNSLTCSQTSSS